MSDAIPLPPRPNLEQYKKRAKDLAHICKSGDRDALRAWATEWIEALVKLHDLDVSLPRTGHRAYTSAEITSRIDRTVNRITKMLSVADPPSRSACSLARAQLALAREHGFASWPKFARHLEALAQPHSPISAFEAAVDAIVNGDLATLDALLREDPKLVRARSTREHRSTLLHYVSANGVEDFRQKTPPNIVEITRRLLAAGADVNAESDAYGGRSTTLGLTATSYHPEAAGVQLPLLDLLIAHGARIDGPDGSSTVNACLHNGRGEAAVYLASRGARLDLEGAAGAGLLDIVTGFFQNDGSLKPPATPQQLHDGFAWACQFGRTDIVAFLMQRAAALDAGGTQNRQIGLNWAAYGGHAEIVALLLARGTPVSIRDESHQGTALDWALYGWGNASPRVTERGHYYDVVALLVRSGARLDPKWYQDDPERQRAATKMQADPRMLAALNDTLSSP